MQEGTIKRCHQNLAYEQFEIQDVSIGFGSFSQSQNRLNITIGNTIYAIDLSTNTGTKTTNPLYDQLVAALQDTDPDDMADPFIAAMDFTATGATKAIAEATCNVYRSTMTGAMCLMDNGLFGISQITGADIAVSKGGQLLL